MTTRRSARIALQNPEAEQNNSRLQQHDAPDNDNGPSQSTDTVLCTNLEPEVTDTETRPSKRRRTHRKPKPNTKTQPLLTHPRSPPPPDTEPPHPLPTFPHRTHQPAYHHPLLLTSTPTTAARTARTARTALLTWFTKASALRTMPWRKPFTPPAQLSRAALSQRAYEVWISEIMLQQTRVQTVVGYWTRWMARWPTIWDLAEDATEDEVVGAWAGLGYYSRARRVWMAARAVCISPEDGGLLPGTVEGLMALPGVGRYSAGAVAAIVFGVPAAMVDGNVLRVLSRQMGVFGDVKGDKAVVDLLWAAAEGLAKAVAEDGEDEDEDGVSDRPGRWGQALMELGSTVCTPKPNCAVCPITETCRAYAEGRTLAKNGRDTGTVEDVEDLCTLCAPFDEAIEDDEGRVEVQPKHGEGRLSRFFASTQTAKPTPSQTQVAPDARTMGIIIQHARKFPLKKPKKKVREEEILVCAVRRSSDEHYLIHRRPDKGLLAGLWELPSHTLPDSNDSTAKERKAEAESYVSGFVCERRARTRPPLKHVGELGSVPWLFSHLKLTMHVHLFELDHEEALPPLGAREQWASVEKINSESMGTGMKKCWSLVKERIG
ncbi:A/G-specific adenine DNA glycosylase [Chaetomidium leptoderma]|uniref:Adenine DNA glycosylase n=1 Tax=Chaetomidium leptoderma TaxID=669021 RepID=A0AAN6VCW7_9PEZI|nr:A/G-specific adenine DNA glycosylase [Chaetomidium leptoderma]